ncbi:MAG: S1 RNA-binding domain-containing protein, partial [Halanaerobium sp.]|nr:S1 RNA-binding domain-containing protein [Halanaerobium sp.]
FGAFVDLGGIEGLLHISEMSWGRIDHPSEVVEEGEEIEVKVLGVDREAERISLGLKQILPDPWDEFITKYHVGDVVDGTITKTVSFGAFMEIEKGIEGLIHISQLAHRHVVSADDVVKEGDEVKAKIINIDEAERKVGLSLKALEEQKKEKPKKQEKKKKKEEKIADETSGITIGEMVGDILKRMEVDDEE